jgi:hypothetical protein
MMMRRLLRLLPLLVLAISSVGGVRTVYRYAAQNIAFHPLPLVSNAKAPARVGALKFLGAWEMQSRNSDFGGISALAPLADGRFLALSDSGMMIAFVPPGGVSNGNSFIAPLPGAFGRKIRYKDRDSEALAIDPVTGRVWVSYEINPTIRRFPPSLSRIDGVARPAIIRHWDGNRAGEAFARLADGRFLLFSEGQDRADGSYDAVLFSGDPVEENSRAVSFGYRPPNGFKATDAVQLPGGQLLVLNRRIGFPEGFSAKLTLLDPQAIRAGEAIKGRVIATLAAPMLVDNMEGIAITNEGGRMIVWMVSDNNFNIWQRTLLMKFELHLPSQHQPKEKPGATDAAPGFDSL